MASKEWKTLDPNQLADMSPRFLQDMILLVKCMIQGCEFLKGAKCRNIRSYKQLKTSLQKLLNLLHQVNTLDTYPAVKKYLAHLESLQAEFSVINNDTSGLCTEATTILEFLRSYVVSRKEVTKSGVAHPKTFNSLGEEDYKQFYNFVHARIPPYMIFAYPVRDGRGDKPDKNGKNKGTKALSGNKSHSNNNPPPIADDLAAATMKNEQPPDDDLPPSGEAVQQVTNPENPPLYYDALAGLTSGGSMLSTTQPQGIHVSYMNGEESRKQLPAVEQQSTVYSGGTELVKSVEATDQPTAENSAQLFSPSHSGLIHSEPISPAINSITVATKEAIKDIQKQTELGSFSSECGELIGSRPSNSLVPPEPLCPPVGTVTVTPIPASDKPKNVVNGSTEQAATVLSTEVLQLDPPDTRS